MNILAATWKTLKYYGFFKNNPYFYYRLPIEIATRVFLKNRILAAEILFDGKCNFSCAHCSSDEYLNKGGKKLSLAQLDLIAEELKSAGALSIAYVGGEPTLRKDLYDIIRMTCRHKLLPSIITNASTLNPEKIDGYFKAGLANMGFSIYSMEPSIHDHFVNFNGAHDKLMESIYYCIKRHYTFSVCIVPTNENLSDGSFQKIIDFALKNDIRCNVNLPAPVGKILESEHSLLTRDSLDVFFNKYFHYPNILADFKMHNAASTARCPMGNATIYILPDGEVCPCTFTQISFGNIFHTPIAEILKKMNQSTLLKNLDRTQCPISMDREFIKEVHSIMKNDPQYPPRWNS